MNISAVDFVYMAKPLFSDATFFSAVEAGS